MPAQETKTLKVAQADNAIGRVKAEKRWGKAEETGGWGTALHLFRACRTLQTACFLEGLANFQMTDQLKGRIRKSAFFIGKPVADPDC